jgi:hypothetical protein
MPTIHRGSSNAAKQTTKRARAAKHWRQESQKRNAGHKAKSVGADLRRRQWVVSIDTRWKKNRRAAARLSSPKSGTPLLTPNASCGNWKATLIERTKRPHCIAKSYEE